MSQVIVDIQGKKGKAVFPYKANYNDELTFKIDDLIVLIQSSEDGTWFEGTLNNRSGWFPSNYVHIIEDEDTKPETNNQTQKIELINEIKKCEESFIDDVNMFLKVILIPLQVSTETILPGTILKQIQNSIDEITRLHSTIQEQLNELPQSTDAKIGHLFMNSALQFKSIHESYSKMNPVYINAINKQRDLFNKQFESSRHLTQPAIIFSTKSLTLPFRQIDTYIKLLKDIQILTEDYHVDRGEIQRSIEFFEELALNCTEIRKKKEYEIEIMATKINNINEDIFLNNEPIFLSSVLIMNENGEKKDRIIILFAHSLVILSNYDGKTNTALLASKELFFEHKINLLTNDIELIRADGKYDNAKYCFELVSPSHPKLIVICSTLYDWKMWIESLTNVLQANKLQAKSQSSIKAKLSKTSESQRSLTKTALSPLALINTTPQSPQQSITPAPMSPVGIQQRKVFSLRPHPPLVPHFQLPSDTLINTDGTATLKRSMYKKPQLAEPTGKYHGSDDDLKLLNLIESYWKTKIRQSVNLNLHDASMQSNAGKSTLIQTAQKQQEFDHMKTSKSNDEKLDRLETSIQSLNNEINDLRKSNKELKQTISGLQKQLDLEKVTRRKLEQFIRKHHKGVDVSTILNIEHESNI